MEDNTKAGEVKTTGFVVNCYGNYVQAFLEMFGMTVQPKDKVNVEYAQDKEAKTVSFFGKFVTNYKVTTVEVVPFVYQNSVDLEIAGVKGQEIFKTNFEMATCTTLDGFELARKIFYIILDQYKGEITRSKRTPEQKAQQALAKIIAKYINKGWDVQSAVTEAKKEMEGKSFKLADSPAPAPSQAPEGEAVSTEDISEEF